MFKNHEKSLIFEKTKARSQTVLPDKSLALELVENTKMVKIQMRLFERFLNIMH